MPPFPTPPSRQRFLVSATQTSGKPDATLADFALVERYDLAANRVESHGSALPSSEALTHSAIYDLTSEVRAVFHVHAPELWRRAAELDLPTTSLGLREGTAELATEIRRLRFAWVLAASSLVAINGHEDGMISFGKSKKEASQQLVTALARAYG